MAATASQPKGPPIKMYDVVGNDVQVNMGLPTIMKIITLAAPYFLVLLFIMISIINSNIKGFSYFFGLIILYGMVAVFQRTLPNNNITERQAICSLFDKYVKIHPSFISGLYVYTITFMLFPMILYHVYNIKLITILLVCYVIDIIVRKKYNCTNAISIFGGSCLGLGVALSWAYILKETNNKSLLYYDDLVSNKLSCTRPSNEQFKCSVFQNGELLQTISPPS
jgi:hypothetical protein